MRPRIRRLPAALLAALLAMSLLVAAACGDDDDEGSSGAGDGVAVRIADKGFAESFIVAQAYAQALDAQGFASDVTSLASTEIADRAIRDGEIDVYPEYVGTSYQTVLGLDAAQAPDAREAQFEEVRTAYEKRGLTALTPAPFNNGNAVACTQEAVNQYSITTLSDLGKASAEHRLLGQRRAPDPAGRPAAAEARVRLRPQGGQDRQHQPALQAHRGRAGECVYAFGTDPKLGQLDLVLIEDDKGTYSAGLSYQTFPVVNKAFYDGLTEEQRTAFTDALDAVNAALTQEAIIPLISRVEFDQEDPDAVAAEFLAESGVVAN